MNQTMEPNHGSDNSKHPEMPPHTDAHEALLTTNKRSNSSSSSSSCSSSSSSSSGSPFDDDAHLHPKLDGDAPSSHSPKVESSPQSHSPKLGSSSPQIASPPDGLSHTPEPSLLDMPANQSPPVQVMQRAEESSPYRIPSTVFARSPSTPPVEWSVTSNESLFSIHMGNNSFSGDQIFLMGRSGELGKPGEYNNYLESKPMEPKNSPNNKPYPMSPESESGQRSMDMGSGGIGVTEAAAETMKDVIRVTEDQNKITTPPVGTARNSSSYSRRSSESATSIVSFAFPILTGDGSRTISAKVDPAHPLQTQEDKDLKEQQSQQQEEQKDKMQEQPPSPAPAPAPAPDAAATPPPPAKSKWFPCFSCCSFCC